MPPWRWNRCRQSVHDWIRVLSYKLKNTEPSAQFYCHRMFRFFLLLVICLCCLNLYYFLVWAQKANSKVGGGVRLASRTACPSLARFTWRLPHFFEPTLSGESLLFRSTIASFDCRILFLVSLRACEALKYHFRVLLCPAGKMHRLKRV